MTRPLKISEKGAPLSCNEFDNNIDRLLDRANHTGQQSGATISDLDRFVENLDFIRELKDDAARLAARLDIFTDDVVRSELADAITTLRSELLLLITQLEGDITDHDKAIQTINTALNSIRNNIQAIEGAIGVIPTLQSNVNNFFLQIQQVISNVNTEIVNRSAAVAHLQNQLITEISQRSLGDNNELNARVAGDAAVRHESITHTNNVHNILINHINVQKRAKAWIVFNSYNGAVSDSNGVSAITKLGQGMWLINWAAPYNRHRYTVQATTCEWTYGGNPTPTMINVYAEDDVNIAVPGFQTYLPGGTSGGDGYIFPSGVIIRIWGFHTLPNIIAPFPLDVPYVAVTAYD